MAWFMDSSPCIYFPFDRPTDLRSIGWLEKGHDFPSGKVSVEVFNKLRELFKDAWQPTYSPGFHECDFCLYLPARGTTNLFIPGDGFLFVCPELIVHYMNAHGYCPPADFCAAVLRCPDTRSMEYKRAVLANGGRSLVSMG